MLSLLLLAAASAEVPMPVYPRCGEPYAPELCPDDLDEEWYLISYIPEGSSSTIRSREVEMGSGIWADRAWRHHTGRWDSVIAVCDSGLEWDKSELVNKIWLNTAELPLPQDGDGLTHDTWDLDGNGLVNVQDYAEDPRVSWEAGREAADWLLDPSDLIYTFSDGIDDDGNGYIDDIAGWDFFADDNDAYTEWDDGYGTHGTGVFEGAAGEGDNGQGEVGVCPNCALLPCRIGDSFITDGGRVSRGVAYSVDSGARVVALAVGGLSNPSSVPQALQHARGNDVVVVGAAGDENSYHRNLPGGADDVLYVHSIRGNNAQEDGGVYSYLNFWNCNNYGPRMDVVAPAEACATGAVSHIAGLAGLLISAAVDQGDDLTPGEVKQLIQGTTDDIWLNEEELEEAAAYPSSEGWDPFYGYGRVNAERSLLAVLDGAVPPEARLSGPGWFEYFDYAQTPTLDVRVEASARGGGVSWTLEVAAGWEPADWTLAAEGQSGDEVVTLDLAAIGPTLPPVPEPDIDEGVIERVERVHGPLVTARLRVTDGAGRSAEARRSFYVHTDPDLLAGFPLRLGASGESGPILVDFDGDDVLEIVVGDADGAVHAIRGSGAPVAGWPVFSDPLITVTEHADAPAFATGAVDPDQREGFIGTVAAADLDGDGAPEVVGAGIAGGVYAWDASGARLPGFPVSLTPRAPEEFDTWHTYDNGFVGAPTLYDLDGDGDREIIAAGMDSRLYAWHHDGSAFGPYPVEICHPENCGSLGDRIITSVTAGDLDGDGDVDLGLGTNEILNDRYSLTFVIDAATGAPLPGWPRAESGLIAEAALLPLVAWGHPASLAFVDMDADGDLEVFDQVMIGQGGVLDHEGEEMLELNFNADHYGEDHNTAEPSFVILTNNPAFGDMDQDGVPDPIMGGAGTYGLVAMATTVHVDFQQVVGAWSGATGEPLPGWPRQVEDLQFLMAPAIADVGGSSLPEAVYGSGGGVLHAWDALGDIPSGWPKLTGQWMLGSPAVGDVNGDGWLDVVVNTREGYLFAWCSRAGADQDVQWASIHHDAANTGNYHPPLPAQAGPPQMVVPVGGCCRGEGESAWLVAPLALLLGGRRRRRPVSGRAAR